MSKRNLGWKRISTDIAGYGCLLGALLFGWLPGPGGIPLLLAGLGFLSVYNPWAKRLLKFVKRHSSSVKDMLFQDAWHIKLVWDVFIITLLVIATFIIVKVDNRPLQGIAVGFYCLSIVVFLFNRNRIRYFKRNKKM